MSKTSNLVSQSRNKYSTKGEKISLILNITYIHKNSGKAMRMFFSIQCQAQSCSEVLDNHVKHWCGRGKSCGVFPHCVASELTTLY